MAKKSTRNDTKTKTTREELNVLHDISSFHLAAKLPLVQNKWIELGIWLELMKHITPNIDVVNRIVKSNFKRAMTNDKNNMTSSNLRVANVNCYYHVRSKMKVRGKPQYVDAILVTEPGQLPSLSQSIAWHHEVIIDLPPSWCTRFRLPRSITPPPPSQQRRRFNSSLDPSINATSSQAATQAAT